MKGCEVTDAKTFAAPPFLLYELAVCFSFWVSLPSAVVMLGPLEEHPLWSVLASLGSGILLFFFHFFVFFFKLVA